MKNHEKGIGGDKDSSKDSKKGQQGTDKSTLKSTGKSGSKSDRTRRDETGEDEDKTSR